MTVPESLWLAAITNRSILRYLGKLNRQMHEKRIDQSEYDALNKILLKASAALNEVPKTILDLK